MPNVNERNAMALSEEQAGQKETITQLTQRLEKLEKEYGVLRVEFDAFKAMVLPKVMGSGATSE